jgi:hypothetical protein
MAKSAKDIGRDLLIKMKDNPTELDGPTEEHRAAVQHGGNDST